jgi:hypothetical protein
MKHRKLTPAERVIYNYGHFDGERGLAPRSAQFTERQREIYNHAYGKGADSTLSRPRECAAACQ